MASKRMNTTYEIPQTAWRAIWPLDDACYRSGLVRAIENELKSLGEGETDTLLLAARRMTCTYALLEEHGLTRAGDGVVMSDRYALLSSPEWWRGRRAVLLDDTRLTGATLNRRRKLLESLKELESVRAHPAVDLDASSDSLSSLRDHLHLMYAKAFSEGLLPYFTDFPTSEARPVPIADLERVWRADGWKVVDVSNAAMRSANFKTFTLFPDAETLRPLWSEHPRLTELVRVAKLRVFTRYLSATEMDVRVVPIALINPVTAVSATEAARRLGFDVRKSHREALSQAVGYIGYLIADYFMRSVQMARPIAPLGRLTVDTSLRRLLLGPELDDQVEHHRQSLGYALSALECVNAPTGQAGTLMLEKLGCASRATLEDNYFGIGDDLAIPVNAAFDDIRRGECGLDVLDLSERTHMNVETASLALDVLNDLGLVVPEISVKEGMARRVFRPGEVRPEEFPEGLLGGRLARVDKTYVVTERPGGSQALSLFSA